MAHRVQRGLWVIIFSLIACTAICAQGNKNHSDPAQSSEQDNPGVAVRIDGRPVLNVYSSVGAYSAEERAAHIEQRILYAAENHGLAVNSIHTQDQQAWTEILSADGVLMSVTDEDAHAEGVTRQSLADTDAALLRDTIERYRAEHTWKKVGQGFLFSILATLALGIVLRGLGSVRKGLRKQVEGWFAGISRDRQSKFGTVLAQMQRPVLIAGAVLRWIGILLLLQFYLTLVFRFFPATQQLSHSITDWLLSQLSFLADSGVDYLPNLLLVIVIAVVTHFVVRLNGAIFRAVESGSLTFTGFYRDWARPTANVIRILIIVLAVVVVFPYLPGSKSPAFQGISVFFGLLLSLGSSSAVANIIAGTILTYMRSFQLGDWVRIGDTTGEIVEKSLLVTRIRTPKNEVVTIPNGTVMNSSVMNYSAKAGSSGVVFHTTVSIGYDVPWRKVHELLIQAAAATADVRKEPEPFVLQTALNDFYVSYELNAYTDSPKRMAAIYSALHQNIQDQFNQAGIEIMSPHYSQIRDGNTVTIPEQYRSKDYEPPAFRLKTQG